MRSILFKKGFLRQIHFPILPNGAAKSRVQKRRRKNDLDAFRMITRQFCVNGNSKQIEIALTFGIRTIGGV